MAEDKMAASLHLPPGSYHVLDAGCGAGHVAIHLAGKYGFKIQGIDIVQHHLDKARWNIARSGLPENQIAVQKMDYHHSKSFGDQTFDGIYFTLWKYLFMSQTPKLS
jgi:sterol 24-C-methyltransferase